MREPFFVLPEKMLAFIQFVEKICLAPGLLTSSISHSLALAPGTFSLSDVRCPTSDIRLLIP
jgi:hypothetical protein